MHMYDALIAPAVATTMYACSAIATGYSVKKVRLYEEPKKIPMMGVMGAFVFAAQMINFTIPGTGSSGHIAGGMLLSAVLGPYAGFLTLIAVLAIQCLLFADGGILALGCNIWNMAFYGCFIGSLCIWNLIMRKGITKNKIMIASIVGCIVTLQMGAFSVVLETYFSGITELPFSSFVLLMQPIHLAIGLIEGLITSAVLIFIYEARPELLVTNQKEPELIGKQGKLLYKKTLTILIAIFLITGGAISLFASSLPDGLEWSIEKINGSNEIASKGVVYTLAERIQSFTAILPDYSWKNSDSLTGTSFSGIVGGIIVIAVCFLICHILKYMKKRNINE